MKLDNFSDIMGNVRSKVKFGARGKGKGKYGASGGDQQSVSYQGDGIRGRDDEYDDVELMLLRRAIMRDPESFVLNNLMMCVQFFGNYEEEMNHVKETLVSSREAELNKKLPPQKHVLLPDVLQEHVARNVGFTSTRQTFRPTIEPLQPVRIYVVHDNIEVTEQNYPPQYITVSNDVTYNMLLKPGEHQGYVKLQLLEENNSLLRHRVKEEDIDLSSIAENDDEIYSDGDSVYVPKPNAGMAIRKPNKRRSTPLPPRCVHSQSLPDLHNEEMLYEDRKTYAQIYDARSTQDIRTESDYEHLSSAEERQFNQRTVNRAYPKQLKGSRKTCSNRSPASSTSSGYRSGSYALDSESDCTCSCTCNSMQSTLVARSCNAPQIYAHNCAPKTPQEISGDCYSSSEIPKKCFKKVTYTSEGKVYDPREERKQLINSKQRRIKLALRRHNYDVLYVSSFEFMKNFINLFVYQLADPLGFDQEAVEDVKLEGCVVYCDKVMVHHVTMYSRVEPYEIIPTVWLQWPECAQEWLERPRSTWPDYNDIGKVKDFGCYLVPEGFLPKKGDNPNYELEWQLTFPAAERYLETCMTHSQVQIYLIALMLHKTFMRPVFDTMFGLTTSHIRNQLFWMIEENDRPSKWPDNRMGECLLQLLNAIYHCISQNDPILPDYFVRDRNLFQRIPSEHLLHTQKQLKRIIENPVMYVFHAMENIRYSDKFFPRLDYEMLLKILTIDSLALVNPALGRQIYNMPVKTTEEDQVKIDERYRPGSFWDNAKQQTGQQKGQQKIYCRVVTNKTLINPRKAIDSIIEISIRCAELEGPRLSALLDFFIRHFTKMAVQCHHYGAEYQKTVYLDQADRLAILLLEHVRYRDDARAYRDKIKALKKRRAMSRSQDEPPETPKRNPETMPIFVASLKDRFSGESPEKLPIPKDEVTVNERKLPEEPNKNERTTTAIVHEVRFRESIEKSKPPTTTAKTTTSTIENTANSKSVAEQKETVTLVKSHDESFLTETTYI